MGGGGLLSISQQTTNASFFCPKLYQYSTIKICALFFTNSYQTTKTNKGRMICLYVQKDGVVFFFWGGVASVWLQNMKKLINTIRHCYKLSQTVRGCHRLSQTIGEYHRSSQIIRDCHRSLWLSRLPQAELKRLNFR